MGMCKHMSLSSTCKYSWTKGHIRGFTFYNVKTQKTMHNLGNICQENLKTYKMTIFWTSCHWSTLLS